jgi:(1->4)-alpha-D-glucan 1-alpha-D-glucosylmutase
VALREIIAHFPVYRTYIETFEISEPDKHYFTQACHLAQESNPDLVLEIQFIERFFLFQLSHLGDEDKKTTLATIQRFQQITSPAMAKSVEDNFFYIYSRLLSLNEVGCSASHFGITTRDFHQFNTQRIKHWKHAQNCVGTHDTKRGEDQRMRLNVLSEIPKEFAKMLRKWRLTKKSFPVLTQSTFSTNPSSAEFLLMVIRVTTLLIASKSILINP